MDGERAYATEWLVNFRHIIKCQDALIKELCDKFLLTKIEGTIITFLYNHPGRDTAGDIVELRMLSKGNVSKAVEALIQKELIQREQDEKDRRKIHLSLLPAAEPMILALEEKQREFSDAIFSGFSKEEKQLFHEMNSRIAENILGIMKRSNLK